MKHPTSDGNAASGWVRNWVFDGGCSIFPTRFVLKTAIVVSFPANLASGSVRERNSPPKRRLRHRIWDGTPGTWKIHNGSSGLVSNVLNRVELLPF
jgi:hypothetical protein